MSRFSPIFISFRQLSVPWLAGFRGKFREKNVYFYPQLFLQVLGVFIMVLFSGCSSQKQAEVPEITAQESLTPAVPQALRAKEPKVDETLSQVRPEASTSISEEDVRGEYYLLSATGSKAEVLVAQTQDESESKAFSFSDEGIEITLSDQGEQTEESHLDVLSNSPEAREYRSALRQFEKTNFDEARRQFSAFYRKHPTHWLAGSALYWRGVAERALGELNAAQVTLATMLRLFKDSTRCSDAQLELAHVYYSQGNESEARRLYHLTLRNYPKTPAAQAVPTEYLSSFQK